MAGPTADLEGATALCLAARGGSRELFNLLIDNGAETAAKDNLRRTPLRCCAELDYIAVTKLLVERRSLLSAGDNAWQTARELAQDTSSDRSMRALAGELLSVSIIPGYIVFL